MAPPAKKRKTRAKITAEYDGGQDAAPAAIAAPRDDPNASDTATAAGPTQQEHTTSTKTTTEDAFTTTAAAAEAAAAKAQERADRFKALQARAKTSAQRNLKEATFEAQRLATDPALLNSLHRKSAVAQHNLMKADADAAGEDFERKRAWDWTVEESEKWDKRLKKKAARNDDQAFQDYRQNARKVYKRQLRQLQPDMEGYDKEKAAAIERAAAHGGLDIVETEDGELIAVDKEGTFYSTTESTTFVEHRPEKGAVDKLVKELQDANDARMRKARKKDGEDGDVTYINEGNKRFNQKLARAYDKYTTEIRDSFERGTMI